MPDRYDRLIIGLALALDDWAMWLSGWCYRRADAASLRIVRRADRRERSRRARR